MKALDLAAHVINRSIDLGAPVTPLKLQNILYILEVKSLVYFGKSLIDENFKAWKYYGPLLQKVYDKYSYFVACDIKVRQEFKDELPSDQRNAIINTIDNMAYASFWDLHVFAMRPDTPWAKAYKEGSCEEISKQLMANYAKTLREEMNKEKEK